MAIPILQFWEKYYTNPDEGLGSTYERFIINEVLFKTVKHFKIKKVLEAPSFGFTGMSGINSMGLVQKNCEISLIDHDQNRINYIKNTWNSMNMSLDIRFCDDYLNLPFEDKSFEMSWNFSALWFTPDLKLFLKELDRLSSKVILLMVPNQTGIGYLQQKYTGKDDLKKYLNEDCIKIPNIKNIMNQMGWKLLSHELIDCPLWPDIGMSKEDFLKKFHLDFLIKKPKVRINNNPLTILDYYSGAKPEMINDMKKYEFFERNAPNTFKKIWSHHQYLLFVKNEK